MTTASLVKYVTLSFKSFTVNTMTYVDCYLISVSTKRVVRICKSKDRQHNGQKKKDNRTNNDLQNIHIKLKIE
jgi:hypothetical protein